MAFPPTSPAFRSNTTVRPWRVTDAGIVVFTSSPIGVEESTVEVNQTLCEAYGFTWDKATGTCRAFTPNPLLEKGFRNETNLISGQENFAGSGTSNCQIVGSENTIIGSSRNNTIVGTNNSISEYVNNASVYGTSGEATANNSIVLGCNSLNSDITNNVANRQTMTFMYGVTTTDGTTTNAYLNNRVPATDTSTSTNNPYDSYFVVPENTAIYFQSETLVVRVGGAAAAGAVGDFKAWVERGVVINKSGTLSIDRSRTSPASSGTTTSWSPINSVSGTYFLQTVTGKADMTLEWASTIRMTQIKTNVTL
jgi:hypothetical protein